MRIEWSAAALADLDRFEDFLQGRYPALSAIIAREIIAKARTLSEHPLLGRALAVVRSIGKSTAGSQCTVRFPVPRYEDRLVILRVFHGRESRGRFSSWHHHVSRFTHRLIPISEIDAGRLGRVAAA